MAFIKLHAHEIIDGLTSNQIWPFRISTCYGLYKWKRKNFPTLKFQKDRKSDPGFKSQGPGRKSQAYFQKRQIGRLGVKFKNAVGRVSSISLFLHKYELKVLSLNFQFIVKL